LYHNYRLLVEYDINIKTIKEQESMMIESEVLNVTGMKCGGCETNVKTKLGAIAGVVSVEAFFKTNEVKVEFDNEKTSLDDIIDTITGSGFTVN
jgi:copper chaperone